MSYSNFSPNYLEPESEIKEIKKKKKDRKNKKVKFSDQEDKNLTPSSSLDLDSEILKIKSDSFNDTENNVILESKFSLRNIFLKILLFSLFILVIYLAYLFIFKKKKFLEIINFFNPFKSNSKVVSKSNSNNLSNQSLNNNVSPEVLSDQSSSIKNSIENSDLLSNNLETINSSNPKTSMIENQTIDPNLKGGQEYIDNNQLVNDIVAILKQAN